MSYGATAFTPASATPTLRDDIAVLKQLAEAGNVTPGIDRHQALAKYARHRGRGHARRMIVITPGLILAHATASHRATNARSSSRDGRPPDAAHSRSRQQRCAPRGWRDIRR